MSLHEPIDVELHRMRLQLGRSAESKCLPRVWGVNAWCREGRQPCPIYCPLVRVVSGFAHSSASLVLCKRSCSGGTVPVRQANGSCRRYYSFSGSDLDPWRHSSEEADLSCVSGDPVCAAPSLVLAASCRLCNGTFNRGVYSILNSTGFCRTFFREEVCVVHSYSANDAFMFTRQVVASCSLSPPGRGLG